MKIIKVFRYQFELLFDSRFNRKHPISAILRFVFWNFSKSFKRDFHYKVWGYKFKFWIQSHQSYWLFKNYIMDYDEFVFIEKLSRKGDVIFDIGANIGVYSMWFDKSIKGEGRIFSFEPDSNNLKKFQYNLKLNNNVNAIKLYDCAVSNSKGFIEFFSGLDEQSSISFATDQDYNSTKVETISIDDFCNENAISIINYLKIDVEGAEYLVLEGANGMLSNQAIKIIQLELNDHISNFNFKIEDVVKMMELKGYKLYRLQDKLYPIIKTNYNELLDEAGNNYFFVADMEYINSRFNNS